jgi:hypothetical protein
MKLRHIAVTAALSLAANLSFAQDTTPKETELVFMLVPVEVSTPALQSGCWAQHYDERSFKGDTVTMAGPIVIASTDKANGRQMRRTIDSLVIGPKATLTVYEHRMFKDRTVSFGPNTKEPGLIKKLGWSGRIESLKLDCVK